MSERLHGVGADELLALVDSIHTAGLRADGWLDPLDRMRTMMGIPYAAHMIRSDDHRQRAGVAAGTTQADYQQMLDTYFTSSVYFRRPYPIHTGQIAASRDMAPRQDVLDSAIYQGWNRDHDVHEMLRLALRVEGGVSQVVTLGQPWSSGPFDPATVALCRVLMPHLRSAAVAADRLRGADLLAGAALSGLDLLNQAVLMLDPAGRLFHANRRADELLTRSGMIDATRGRLQAPLPEQTARLHGAIARALCRDAMRHAGSVRLDRPRGSPLAVLVVPFTGEADWAVLHRPAAMVCITDPDGSLSLPVQQLRDLFGLTRAEARLAGDLLAGQEPREIAEGQNRSINTVRTHIARLMAKTGVDRQSRLMALLATLPRLDGPALWDHPAR